MSEKLVNFRPKKELVDGLQFLGFINRKDGTNNKTKNLSEFINKVLIEKLDFYKKNGSDSISDYLKWEIGQLQTERDKDYEKKTEEIKKIVKELENIKSQKKEAEKNDSKTVRTQ